MYVIQEHRISIPVIKEATYVNLKQRDIKSITLLLFLNLHFSLTLLWDAEMLTNYRKLRDETSVM